jgi:hypothetical protein
MPSRSATRPAMPALLCRALTCADKRRLYGPCQPRHTKHRLAMPSHGHAVTSQPCRAALCRAVPRHAEPSAALPAARCLAAPGPTWPCHAPIENALHRPDLPASPRFARRRPVEPSPAGPSPAPPAVPNPALPTQRPAQMRLSMPALPYRATSDASPTCTAAPCSTDSCQPCLASPCHAARCSAKPSHAHPRQPYRAMPSLVTTGHADPFHASRAVVGHASHRPALPRVASPNCASQASQC